MPASHYCSLWGDFKKSWEWLTFPCLLKTMEQRCSLSKNHYKCRTRDRSTLLNFVDMGNLFFAILLIHPNVSIFVVSFNRVFFFKQMGFVYFHDIMRFSVGRVIMPRNSICNITTGAASKYGSCLLISKSSPICIIGTSSSHAKWFSPRDVRP